MVEKVISELYGVILERVPTEAELSEEVMQFAQYRGRVGTQKAIAKVDGMLKNASEAAVTGGDVRADRAAKGGKGGRKVGSDRDRRLAEEGIATLRAATMTLFATLALPGVLNALVNHGGEPPASGRWVEHVLGKVLQEKGFGIAQEDEGLRYVCCLVLRGWLFVTRLSAWRLTIASVGDTHRVRDQFNRYHKLLSAPPPVYVRTRWGSTGWKPRGFAPSAMSRVAFDRTLWIFSEDTSITFSAR